MDRAEIGNTCLFQDERKQVLTTNVFIDQVSRSLHHFL